MRCSSRFVVTLALLAACKQASSSPEGDKAATSAAKPVEVAPSAITPAAVNALVPSALAGKLTFATRELVDQFDFKFTVAVPAGWVQDDGFASLHPADEPSFGSSMRLGKTCAGGCGPKDWAAVTEKEEFASLLQAKVLEDKATATSRLMIVESDKVTVVKYAWWTADASRYAVCSASLKDPYRVAVQAFAKACQAVTIIDGK
jgi:hypothetical protein